MSVWVRCYLCIVLLYASKKCQGEDCIQTLTHPKECIFDDEGHKYDLTSIRNDDGTPRFEASADHRKPEEGWKYSFNPCISFTLGTSGPGSDCQSDVAIPWFRASVQYHHRRRQNVVCRWQGDHVYRRIGKQSTVKFGRYKNTEIRMLHYSSKEGDISWESTVLLKCDLKQERGGFKVWKDTTAQEIRLNLTHKCACADACLLNPTSVPNDRTDSIVIDVVPSVAGGVVLIFLSILIWWRVRIRCRNNDYPPLIRDNVGGGVDEFVNKYPDTSEGSELTSGRNSAILTMLPSSGSSCSDITVPKKDQSFNGKAKMKSNMEEKC